MNQTWKACSIVFIFFITLSEVSHAVPENVPAWFHKMPQAYGPIKKDIIVLVEILREQEIEQDTVGLLVLEGVAKEIEPARLLEAFRIQVDRLLWLDDLLIRSGYSDLSETELSDPLGRLSLYIQSGVERIAVEALVEDRPDLGKVLYAGEALGKIVQFAYSEADEQLRLAKAIITSNVPPRRYSALASAVLRGLSAGLSPERLLDILVEVLSSGGGILQIDQEIRSRGRGS